MAKSRNWDRSPETPADRKFHDLRASGYKGPIDQDGNKVSGAARERAERLARHRGDIKH